METQTTRAECALKPSPKTRGRALVEAWRRSGLSQRAFARQQQIRPHLVSYWSRRFPEPMPASNPIPAPTTTATVDFVEIRTPHPGLSAGEPSDSGIEIRFPSGAVARVLPGVCAMLLRQVVSALAGEPC